MVVMGFDVGGLLMTSDSHLLANGSVLNVTHSSANLGGASISLTVVGRQQATKTFCTERYVYKTTCPGWCFFQFVTEDGHLLTQDQFNGFHASLNLENNQGL